jgi:hypothetical protein
MQLQRYAKAIVPVAVMMALTVLAKVGVTPDMKIEDVITMLITAGLVYFVPNKK